MKVAACLRAVGHNLEPGVSWNDSGQPPRVLRGPVLVTGGTSVDIPTDDHLFPPGIIAPDSRAIYYTLSTVGALCTNSFYHLTEVSHQECQSYWNHIRHVVKRTFSCAWEISESSPPKDLQIIVRFRTSVRPDCDDEYAIGLAAVYFSRCSKLIAPCYTYVADQTTLDCVQRNHEAIGNYDPLPVELQRFRAVTACIILAFTELLVGSEFEGTRHVAMMGLGMDDFVKVLSTTLQHGLVSGLPLWEAAAMVAALHAGTDTEPIEGLRQRKKPAWRVATLGRRAGTFIVIPRLFLHMEPSKEALGFACLDTFVGTIPVDENGWILDGTPQFRGFGLDDKQYFENQAPPSSNALDLERNVNPPSTPFLGPPIRSSPDQPPCISLETTRHTGKNDVLLTGRVSGFVIDQVSVLVVLRVLVRSLKMNSNECEGHASTRPLVVLNTRTSQWREREFKMHEKWHTFVHACGDKAWNLLAAGQVGYLGGMLVFGCPQCVQTEILKASRGIPAAMVDCRPLS